MEMPKRKRTRLKWYDYSSNGAYFITICTKDRKELLSKIATNNENKCADNQLNRYGKIAKIQIEELENRYKNVKVDKYVIMPNHIHLLISIDNQAVGASPNPTISDIICTLKSIVTRLCHTQGLKDRYLFQSSFHDHIIRGEKDYIKIWEYIDTNVIKWEYDCFYNA